MLSFKVQYRRNSVWCCNSLKHCLSINGFVYEFTGFDIFSTLMYSLSNWFENWQSRSISLCRSACCTSLELFHSLEIWVQCKWITDVLQSFWIHSNSVFWVDSTALSPFSSGLWARCLVSSTVLCIVNHHCSVCSSVI